MNNFMQMLQMLQQNPLQILQSRGLNVPPQNLSDPNAIIQHLMNTGQISQQQYQNARMMAERFKR
jgi:hypothetical protein